MSKRPLDSIKIETVDDTMAAILKPKTTWERAEMIFDANRTMRLLIEGHLRTMHPNWDDRRIQQKVAHRMLYGAEF